MKLRVRPRNHAWNRAAFMLTMLSRRAGYLSGVSLGSV